MLGKKRRIIKIEELKGRKKCIKNEVNRPKNASFWSHLVNFEQSYSISYFMQRKEGRPIGGGLCEYLCLSSILLSGYADIFLIAFVQKTWAYSRLTHYVCLNSLGLFLAESSPAPNYRILYEYPIVCQPRDISYSNIQVSQHTSRNKKRSWPILTRQIEMPGQLSKQLNRLC